MVIKRMNNDNKKEEEGSVVIKKRTVIMLVLIVVSISVMMVVANTISSVEAQTKTKEPKTYKPPTAKDCAKVGQTFCNGQCRDPFTFQLDVNNCGSCGNVCSSSDNGAATCTNGQCGVACNAGFTFCNGQCVPNVNFRTDVDNCGACGRVCPTDPETNQRACMFGSCSSCPEGQYKARCTDSDGKINTSCLNIGCNYQVVPNPFGFDRCEVVCR